MLSVTDINLASLTPHAHASFNSTIETLTSVHEEVFQTQLCAGHNDNRLWNHVAAYEAILEHFEGCPVPFLYGPSQTGKTQLSKILFYMLGMQMKAFYKKTTSQKWFLDCCSMSSMPFVIDDPRNMKDRKGTATVPSDLDVANDISWRNRGEFANRSNLA